jgi:uncharacterized membrane protein YqjE
VDVYKIISTILVIFPSAVLVSAFVLADTDKERIISGLLFVGIAISFFFQIAFPVLIVTLLILLAGWSAVRIGKNDQAVKIFILAAILANYTIMIVIT